MTNVQQNTVGNDVVKAQIRNAISNVYDLQKMRIAAGNRLVTSFYLKMGVNPSQSPKEATGYDPNLSPQDNEATKDAQNEQGKLIAELKKDYKRITDAVASTDKGVKSSITALNKSPDPLVYIRDEADYKLVDAYMLLLKSEEELTKVVEKYVKEHPLYDKFFSQVKGCGTLMSAVCIAYLDPYKANHVSSFYMYCGLDTVQDTDKDGNPLFWTTEMQRRKVRAKYLYLDADGMQYDGKVKKTDDFDANGEQIYLGEDNEVLTKQPMMANVNGEDTAVYEVVDTGEEYVGDVYAAQHGRRMGDTVERQDFKPDGTPYTRRSITYNPILKTKLMGVLTGCLIKAKDPVYSKIYYEYKDRLNASVDHKDKKPGHKNMMAERYMIKQFLRNLWTEWRLLEGLPVDEPYEVAKLGNAPHHINQRQVDAARRYKDVNGGTNAAVAGS